MIIVVGKAVLLFNMYHSRSYFDKLYSHNIDQARSRIAEWSRGLSIRGRNQWRTFDVKWSDVDHIAVVSVVDGLHAGCIEHPVIDLGMDSKVKLCMTVTSKVMLELARVGGGARDLIHLCSQLRGRGPIPERHACSVLLSYAELISVEARMAPEPTRLGRPQIRGKDGNWLQLMIECFLLYRKDPKQDTDIFSDLSLAEIFECIKFIKETASSIEYKYQGFVRMQFFTNRSKFGIVVSTNMRAVANNMNIICELAKGHRSRFVIVINLLIIGPMQMILFFPTSDPLETEIDLANY